MTTLERALYYKNKLKISVVPQRLKSPLVPWTEFQTRLPTDEELYRWFVKWPEAGISGIVGSISGIVVIDCDSKEAIEQFENMVPAGLIVPCTQTPRGGRHYYFACSEKLQKQVGFMEKVDFQAEGSCIVMPPSQGANGANYEWLIEPLDVADFPPLSSLPISHSFLPYNAPTPSPVKKDDKKKIMFEEGTRDVDLFHCANCLAKGHMPDSEIEQVLLAIMQSWGEYDEKWARVKVKSAMDRMGRKERNIVQEISDYIEMTTGNFMTNEMLSTLLVTQSEEKKHANVVLHRLWKKGVIEKTGTRNGSWRRVETDCEIIDWRNAPTTEYPVRWPLGVENLVKLYPGNIAILAGVQNAGKTSFCLETIRLNMNTHQIHYYSSEGGAQELNLRITSYHPDMAVPDDWKFVAKERSQNFADVIIPDAFNIVDFMEIYDEFYKLAGWIRDIHNKLTTGIALICIQKRSSTKKDKQDFGRGGEMTAEKPRLYMAMDRGIIKIVKAKIWRDHDYNPNGLMREFNLVGGYKWLPKGDWYHEGEDKDFGREY